MKRYKRIRIEEREEIMKSLAEGKSLREIAREINRNVSSISREIKRNKKGRKGNKDLRQESKDKRDNITKISFITE